MYSDSADAWMSPEVTSQGSAKRTLYTMLKHMGLPTDIVTGKKTGFFAPFIYKMHHFTKTGSGQM